MKRRKRHIRGVSKPKPVLERMWQGIPPQYSRHALDKMTLSTLHRVAQMWLLDPSKWKQIGRPNHDELRLDVTNKILRVQNLKMSTRHELNVMEDADLHYVCEVRGCVNLSYMGRQNQIEWALESQQTVMRWKQDQWPKE